MPPSKVDYRTLPPVGRRDVVRDLHELGLRPGDTLLVHSAMSRIGNVGSAECRLARAGDILDVALSRLAADPFYLRVREPSDRPSSDSPVGRARPQGG